MSVPMTATTCVSICPCACTSCIGGLFNVLSPQTAFEEFVSNDNLAINHQVQSPRFTIIKQSSNHQTKYGLVSSRTGIMDTHYHGNEIYDIVLCDPIHLSWPHVM